MPKKPKFRPKITRIKLNPEQAVLTCSCYLSGLRYVAGSNLFFTEIGGHFRHGCLGRSMHRAIDVPAGTGDWGGTGAVTSS